MGRIKNKNERNLGLDIVRSIAIISVLASHTNAFFNVNLSFWGVLGVEIFFILSGFLIGKIIINSLVKNPSVNSLKEFYMRRWFRTLPLYYLVLFLVSIINHTSIPYRNLVFMQNFNENALAFLPVSWSLSIEEWFYLLVPLILIAFLKLFDGKMKKRYIFFMVSIGVVLISFLLRSYVVIKYNPLWDFGVRKQIFLRLDSIMIGVILAGVKIYYRRIYKHITESKISVILFCIGFLVTRTLYVKYLDLGGNAFNQSVFGRIFMFSLMSITCLFFVAWFDTSFVVNKILIRYKISKIFKYISIMSYSIYLIHHTLYHLVATKFHGFKGLIIATLISLTFAWLLHILCEVPFMKLRDKITFVNKRKIEVESISKCN
ncbi:acyltransferase family protein [Clostridium saccharoperbutylacetonicum]